MISGHATQPNPSSRFRSAVTEIVGRIPTSLITCGKSGWPPVFRDKKGAINEAFHYLERAYGSARVSGVSGDQRRRADQRESTSGDGADVLRHLPQHPHKDGWSCVGRIEPSGRGGQR